MYSFRSLPTRERHSSSDATSPEAKNPRDVINQAQKRLKALSPIRKSVNTLSKLITEEQTTQNEEIKRQNEDIKRQNEEIKQLGENFTRLEARLETRLEERFRQKWNGTVKHALFYCVIHTFKCDIEFAKEFSIRLKANLCSSLCRIVDQELES